MNAELQNEPVRRKAVWGARVKMAVALAGAVLLAILMSSCSQSIRTGQASSYLVLTSLTGGSGNDATVESDVRADNGGIFADNGQAGFQLVMKDAGGLGPTAINAITITQYHVEYIRSDGRNTPGVDVPFPFDGGMTTTISGSGGANFTLVRIQAKLEAPLAALAFQGGAQVISTVARVTFYGHDQSGRQVSVSGNIDVSFADWAG